MPVTGTPRTDPGGRNLRTGLPPWVFDAKAHARPGTGDARAGDKSIRQLGHSIPRGGVPLAATLERPPPVVDRVVPERVQPMKIGRGSMVGHVPADQLSQPFPLHRDRLVETKPQAVLERRQGLRRYPESVQLCSPKPVHRRASDSIHACPLTAPIRSADWPKSGFGFPILTLQLHYQINCSDPIDPSVVTSMAPMLFARPRLNSPTARPRWNPNLHWFDPWHSAAKSIRFSPV